MDTVSTRLSNRVAVLGIVLLVLARLDLAREYFDSSANGATIAQDARTWLRTSQTKYDIVLHDTFTGGATPEHLLSVEVMRRAEQHLTPGSLLVLNLVGATDGPLSGATRAVARTIREVFPHVRLFRDGPPAPESDLQNLVFFASQRAIHFELGDLPAVASTVRRSVFESFQQWEVQHLGDGPLITDEESPIAQLGTAVSTRHHAVMREMYPAEFWLR